MHLFKYLTCVFEKKISALISIIGLSAFLLFTMKIIIIKKKRRRPNMHPTFRIELKQ